MSFNSKTDLQPRIGRLVVLQGPEWQIPAPSKALSLIRRLANDPGVVGIMKRHDWNIGSLEEMPPEGYVGISPVCVLGVNIDKGMKVELRLRTDDKLGFRKYHIIRSTLLHELAHNDISQYDQSFWSLVSKLNKEVIELDWTKSTGHTTGRGRRQVYSDRLSASERGFDSDSSEEDEPYLDDPDHEGYLLGTQRGNTGRSRLLDLVPTPSTKPSSVKSIPKTSSSPSSSTLNSNTHSPTPNNLKAITPTLEDTEESTSPSSTAEIEQNKKSEENPSKTIVVDYIPSQVPKKSRNYWRCPDCTYHNELHLSNCLSCGGLAPLLRTETIEVDAAVNTVGLDITELHDPVVIRSRKLESALNSLVRGTDTASAKLALETLEVILGNVLLNPTEEKFRSIFLTNKTFYARVGRHSSAIEFLIEVGFTEDKLNQKLVFKRHDMGLIWMAKSTVQHRLETFKNSFTTEDDTQPSLDQPPEQVMEVEK